MDPTELSDLATSSLFRDLEDADTLIDPDDWTLRDAAAGTTVMGPSEPNSEVSVLLSGELQVTVEAETLHSVARIKAGECFGELSVLDNLPPSAYVLASQPSRYASIDRDRLWKLINIRPEIARNLLRILTERVREKNALLIENLGLLHEYRTLAETDALTGLHNRTWMMDIFPQQLDLSRRIGHPVSLLTIDIDHFKRLNDEHGHPSGDLALQHLAELMRRNLRETDLAARHGGEEFVVMMPATHGGKAHYCAERLRRVVSDTPVVLDADLRVNMSVSIGVAESLPGWSLEELLVASDRALYQAKDSGRNRVCLAPNPFPGNP